MNNSNSSVNDEPNSSSTPKNKKTRSRKTGSSSGRPIRNKIVKESSLNNKEPYTIPYSTRSQTQQLRQKEVSLTETPNQNPSQSPNQVPSTIMESDMNIVDSDMNHSTIMDPNINNVSESNIQSPSTIVDSNMDTTESHSTNVDSNMNPTENNISSATNTVTNPQVPRTTERKRHCAKCKESTNIVKMINSKISRIEELVNNLKKVTDELNHDAQNNNNLLYQSDSSSSPSSNKPFTSFKGMDFSKMSIGDLQSFVMVVTNTINNTKKTKNLSVVKLEFEESS